MRGAGFVVAVVVASAAASPLACASFSEGEDPAVSSDASTADATDAPAPKPPENDGGTTPFCTKPATTRFDFAANILGFEKTENNGKLTWVANDGYQGALGALEAVTTAQGSAQIAQNFEPVGSAARLSFATKVKAAANPGTVRIGCTLELMTSDTSIDSNDVWVALGLKISDGEPRLTQDAHKSFAQPSVGLTDVSFADWVPVTLEMNDIAGDHVDVRATVAGREIMIPTRRLPLEKPPVKVRVKCGIDDADVAGDVLVDSVVFDMCTP